MRTPGGRAQARHQRLLAPPCPGHRPGVEGRERGIEVEAPGLSGLQKVRVPHTQTLLTEAQDVMSAVRTFWRELYDKRPVDLPSFQAVLGRHVPRVPEGTWAQDQQYFMQDLRSAVNKADGKAPGPNQLGARFINAFRHPSSDSSSTSTAPSSVAPRYRPTGGMRTFGSAPRSRSPPSLTTTGP